MADDDDLSLNHYIREQLDAGVAHTTIADKVTECDEWPAWATELLVARVHLVSRSRTRTVERSVVAGLRDVRGRNRASVRKRLASHGFALPDGTWVGWLDATADQHRERAAWLRSKAEGTIETAVSHEQAAKEIDRAGVACLKDLAKKAS